MTKVIGIFLLAMWFVIYMAFSWEKKSSALVNMFMGIVSYVIIGACYIVPFWLIFMK